MLLFFIVRDKRSLSRVVIDAIEILQREAVRLLQELILVQHIEIKDAGIVGIDGDWDPEFH